MQNHYYHYRIPKGKSGKYRWISEPNEELKNFQTEKLQKVFYKIKPHEANHGFIPGKSIVSNAQMHVGRKFVLSMDIKNFFPNCSKDKVQKTIERFFPSEIENLQYFLHKESLPQGAPTSPYLANFTLYDFDENISVFTNANNIKYTRYADDLTFSYDSKNLTKALFKLINKEIKKENFWISKKKTKLMPNHKRQMVTGFIVNEKINIPREKRNLLRAWNHLESFNKWDSNDIQLLAGWNGYNKMTKGNKI